MGELSGEALGGIIVGIPAALAGLFLFCYMFGRCIIHYLRSIPRRTRDQWPVALATLNLDRGDLQSQV
jgi:hypothetical protein